MRRKLWIAALKKDDGLPDNYRSLVRPRICCLHFPLGAYVKNKNRHNLENGAIPSVAYQQPIPDVKPPNFGKSEEIDICCRRDSKNQCEKCQEKSMREV